MTVGRIVDFTDDLFEAVCAGDVVEVNRFLALPGARADAVNVEGSSLLLHAAHTGQLEVVRCLVTRGDFVVDAPAVGNVTPLSGAAQGGHLAVVRYLASHKADLESQTVDGSTPLMGAARNGHLDVMRYLASAGCQVDIRNSRGGTALIAAAHSGHLDIVRCLVEELGCDVDAASFEGITALMGAARGGHLQVVRYIAGERGACVDALSVNDSTALAKAARQGHLDVVRYLAAELGADVSLPDRSGATALMAAAVAGHSDVVEYLSTDCGACGPNPGSPHLMRPVVGPVWVSEEERPAPACVAEEGPSAASEESAERSQSKQRAVAQRK